MAKLRMFLSLTKSSDGDKIMLHEYYLHIKERIGERRKGYYNNNNNNNNNNKKDLKAIVKNNIPKEELKNSCILPKEGPHLFV